MSRNDQSTATTEPSDAVALVDLSAAACFLGVSERTIHRLIVSGTLAPVRIPGVRRLSFDINELRLLVETWKAAR